MKEATIDELKEGKLEPFMPLLAEIECGSHFSDGDQKSESWLRQTINSHIARGTRYFGYISKAGDALGVVGILLVKKLFCATTAEIVDIGIVNTYRRCGLGTNLLNYAVNFAREEGAYAVFARTYAADIDTIAFYGRNAFYPVAVIPGTNGPIDEGDIVMRRKISDNPDA